jgi:hypothetical protein
MSVKEQNHLTISIILTLSLVLFVKRNYNDQAKGDEMGRARSMHGLEEECI